MKHQTAFHKVIARDKGLFSGQNFYISSDSINWIHSHTISITKTGQLYSLDENNAQYLLLQSLQSCFVQVFPTLSGSTSQPIVTKRKFNKKVINSAEAAPTDEPPVIFIKTYNNDKLYIKVPSKLNFGNLISSLIVWQSLKPSGLAKKWYCENKVTNSTSSSKNPHELLVCRFKIYGPIPAKSKNLKIVNGPTAPIYQPNMLDASNFDSSSNGGIYPSNHLQNNGLASGPNPNTGTLQVSDINEGWFYTMGVLKSNGFLNFISELDGTLLYSIDIKKLMSSEIREIHHSLFNNSNILFIGQIKELRWNNAIKSILTVNNDQVSTSNNFLAKDGKAIQNNQRILIEFPLHIDLEDWFVGLNYFVKREYIGGFNEHLSLTNSQYHSNIAPPDQGNDSDDNDVTGNTTFNITTTNPLPPLPSAISSNSIAANLSQISNTSTVLESTPTLTQFTKDNFRVSKKVEIDIIEAKFDNISKNSTKGDERIYAEIVMWGLPWSRTAIVNLTNNPFWKESFSTDLPILTQMVHILIKKCSYGSSYLATDKLIGTVYITPDILSKQLNSNSTMMMSSSGNGGITMNGVTSSNFNTNSNLTNDIFRLSIYDAVNSPIGKLLLTVNLKEFHILSPPHFKTLENMLANTPMKDLIKFCNDNVSTSDFENVSLIMLDIFQSLGIEDKWFKALMEAELVNIDKVTRKNYVNRSSNNSPAKDFSSTNNVFNTLFRGSSIFSKSLEKYNLRIGQEYLEKVFVDFFQQISDEDKNCEIDPRYVRIQEKADRLGKTTEQIEDGLSDSDEDDEDSENEEVYRKREQKINAIIDANFNNLYNYVELIWLKIYTTSNDLPEQIKIQLKNFRTKVDLACDPDDKVTALNCLSAFIFLRFFCPAILNPKLFYLTKNHQSGKTQRTLTLIAKILLNLANRQEFSPHKEPHLVKMNKFLTKHHDEIFDYFDKITGRKNDFNEKVLDLSHEVKRFDLGLSGDSTSSELPTTPYLIDKYLRLTQLIHLLNLKNTSVYHNHSSSIATTITNKVDPTTPGTNISNSIPLESRSSISLSSINSVNETGQLGSPSAWAPISPHVAVNHSSSIFNGQANGSSVNASQAQSLSGSGTMRDSYYNDSLRNSNGDIHVNPESGVYQIGSLEFEKLEFLDLVGDNETEGFIKSLCRSNENIFSFITSNISLKDLQKQSTNLMNKIDDLLVVLENPEVPSNYQFSPGMWESFTYDILSRAYLDTNRNTIVFYDKHIQDYLPHNNRKITDNALSTLKLKFQDVDKVDLDASSLVMRRQSFSANSIGSVIKSTSKNPFKKWLRKG